MFQDPCLQLFRIGDILLDLINVCLWYWIRNTFVEKASNKFLYKLITYKLKLLTNLQFLVPKLLDVLLVWLCVLIWSHKVTKNKDSKCFNISFFLKYFVIKKIPAGLNTNCENTVRCDSHVSLLTQHITFIVCF